MNKDSKRVKRPNMWLETRKYSASRTIPGQSLLPAKLMERHLAGTLPDIDLSQKYQYHYDEEGNKIGEPLPLEMHELHKLAVAIRNRQFEEATKARKAKAEKDRQLIIDAYLKEQSSKEPKPSTDAGAPGGVEPVKTPPL